MEEPASAPAARPAPAPVLAPPLLAPPVAQPAAVTAESGAVPPEVPAAPATAYTLSPAALGLPPILPYRDGLPVPAGYHVEQRSAKGLLLTGTGTLVAGYVAALGIGFSKSFQGSLGWLAVPVVGVWPAVAGRRFKCTAADVEQARQCLRRANSEATTIALVAVDGMIQTTGLLLLLAGWASGEPELVLDSLSPVKVTASHRPEGGFELDLTGKF